MKAILVYTAPLALVLLLGIAINRGCIWDSLCSWFATLAAPRPYDDGNKDGKMSQEEREAVIARLKRLKRRR